MLKDTSPGSVGTGNSNGWMISDNFVEYIQYFIKPGWCSIDNPMFLILDNQEGNYDIRVLNMCKVNGIVLLTLSPGSSHKLQSLYISCFGLFKTYCNKAVNDWMMDNAGTPMTVYYDIALLPVNIKHGFETTGVSPFDFQIDSESEYMTSYITNGDENNVKINQAKHNNTIDNNG
ncbi:hypothetical protein ILUMI_14889 [Ignelater luminosus]|uniref:DDE-1 domain-containing protein n=1 Tax=Ignelater luminosus TaxID=2038154 RepID=A0A8K0G9M2_IGNLU|nr:hypothetical protein ILUMI_14889 [Ignelater luminosus]